MRSAQAVNSILLTLLLCSVTACGFHLRGSETMTQNSALRALNVIGENRYDDLSTEIKRLARQYDIPTDNTEADWRLTINKDEIERQRVTATQSVTNDEFILRLKVSFTLHYQQQQLEPIHISREAIFQDNQDNAVSKANEERLIIDELRQQAAQQILQQIQILAANPPECDTDEAQAATAQ